MSSLMSKTHVAKVRTAVQKLYKGNERAVFFYGEAENGSTIHITTPGKPAAPTFYGNVANREKLTTQYKDKEPVGQMKVIAGFVQCVKGLLVFQTELAKGLGKGSTRASIKAANALNKLGIASYTVGEIDGVVEQAEAADPDAVPAGDESSTDGVEEVAKEATESTPTVSEKPSTPPIPLVAIQKLRETMKGRVASFKAGEIGAFGYIEEAYDGAPMLVFSKPGVAVEGKMLQAGASVTAEGAWRCVKQGGIELYPGGFNFGPLESALGVRFRASSKPFSMPTPVDPEAARKELAGILEEVEKMGGDLPGLSRRWRKMPTLVVKGALKEVGKNLHTLRQSFKKAMPGEADEGIQQLGQSITQGLEAIESLYKEAKEAFAKRGSEETGALTGKTKGEMVEAWNGLTEAYEYKHPDEWERLTRRDKLNLDILFDEDYDKNRVKEMQKVGSGVHVQDDTSGLAEDRLKTEREATRQMRAGLTDNIKSRTEKAKEDVKNNSDMAQKMVTLLEENPDLLDTDGLLSRIMGGISGQGQFSVSNNKWDKETDPTVRKQKQNEQNETNRSLAPKVIKEISEAGERLKAGKGEGEDGNRVLQFISCFVDGLTEVTEGKKKAGEQFDKVWPMFRDMFGLEDGDKKALLKRVEGYKEIAGGVADTLSGKGTRKDDTRGGKMPTDLDYKIEDEDALIKGDISGSMHSCLLAQEISESLLGREVENEKGEKVLVKPGIKAKGESVLVTDKGMLDARALDALALTAGGKIGDNDIVLHTAYEMINGMRAISGTPKVNQSQATHVMGLMLKGVGFTVAMESIFPEKDLPWLAKGD